MKSKLVQALASSVILLSASLVLADVPTKISYQGRLSDDSGQPVPDGSYSFVFAVYDVAEGGEPLWSEDQTVSTQDGLFAVELGSVNPLPASVFESSPRYLGIAVNGDPEQSPRSQLTTAPYAFQAAMAPATGGQSPATDWICPYYGSAKLGGDVQELTRVFFLSPNDQLIDITLTFYSWEGEQLDQCVNGINGHSMMVWDSQFGSCPNAAPDGVVMTGWFSVHSDLPISPWGYYLSQWASGRVFAVPLSFYVP